METTNQENIRYKNAERKVKRLKSFYTHLFIYTAVNIFIMIMNYVKLPPGTSFWSWQILVTPLFWGMALLGHAISVFLPSRIFGKEWEEKKINELMNK